MRIGRPGEPITESRLEHNGIKLHPFLKAETAGENIGFNNKADPFYGVPALPRLPLYESARGSS